MPLSVCLTILGPAFVHQAIDDGFKADRADLLIKYATLFIVVIIADALVSTLINVLIQSGGIRSLSELRKKVVEHVSFMGRWDYEKRPFKQNITPFINIDTGFLLPTDC